LTALRIQLDFSGKHAPKITNRYNSLLACFPNLRESLCIFVRFCELMVSAKITEKRCQTKNSLSASNLAKRYCRTPRKGFLNRIGATP
jgi:hypothetical protein